jgi:ElaB/YqjD/DUF883 family membrane-anchored ribosome-binding protein
LLALKAEETTEVEVLQKIKETRELMQDIDNLLTRAGDDRKKKSLLQRYEHVLSEPVDLSDGEAPFEIRGELSGAMEALDERLNEDFRV